jgi:hypothetical protein
MPELSTCSFVHHPFKRIKGKAVIVVGRSAVFVGRRKAVTVLVAGGGVKHEVYKG